MSATLTLIALPVPVREKGKGTSGCVPLRLTGKRGDLPRAHQVATESTLKLPRKLGVYIFF